MTEEQPNSLRHFLKEHRVAPRYYATAYASYHYWELAVDGIGVAQAEPGASHRDTILDYVAAHGHDTKNAHVFVYYPGHPAP